MIITPRFIKKKTTEKNPAVLQKEVMKYKDSELPVNEFRASNETITEVIVPKFAAITLRQHPGEYQSTTEISGDGHRKYSQE